MKHQTRESHSTTYRLPAINGYCSVVRGRPCTQSLNELLPEEIFLSSEHFFLQWKELVKRKKQQTRDGVADVLVLTGVIRFMRDIYHVDPMHVVC